MGSISEKSGGCECGIQLIDKDCFRLEMGDSASFTVVRVK
jgi:hypothetical protein